jgi:hypothetical protein
VPTDVRELVKSAEFAAVTPHVAPVAITWTTSPAASEVPTIWKLHAGEFFAQEYVPMPFAPLTVKIPASTRYAASVVHAEADDAVWAPVALS